MKFVRLAQKCYKLISLDYKSNFGIYLVFIMFTVTKFVSKLLLLTLFIKAFYKFRELLLITEALIFLQLIVSSIFGNFDIFVTYTIYYYIINKLIF